MRITEKDIYTFVFFPDSIDEQKAAFIRKNPGAYSDIIDSYAELKSSLETDLSNDLQEMIRENFAEYNKGCVIKLQEQKNFKSEPDSFYRVAAESEDEQSDYIVKTFASGGDEVIIAKVVKSDTGHRLYLLTDRNNDESSYLVRLLPAGEELLFEKINRCHNLPSDIVVEEIEVVCLENK